MSWIEKPQHEFFGDLNISALAVDQAYLNIFSSTDLHLWLYQTSTNCHSCAFTLVKSVLDDYSIGQNFSNITVDTKFPMKYRLRTSGTPLIIPQKFDKQFFCQRDYHFGEFGVYNWNISKNGCEDIEVALQPVDVYLPLLLNVIIYGLLWTIILFMYSHADRITSVIPSLFKSKGSNEEVVDGPQIIIRSNLGRHQSHLHLNSARVTTDGLFAPRTRKRLRSLDAFRGFSVILMVFVTYLGGDYYFFLEASWDGLYVGSLPFPWLLWTMGVCIPISIQYYMKQGDSPQKICKKILFRSLKLFLSGYIVMSVWEATELSEIRFPGVLQRYAVCHLVCALMILYAMKGKLKTISVRRDEKFRDLTIGWIPWTIVSFLALIQVIVTKFLPVPGCPTGYVGAAGLANDAKYPPHCVGGAASFIDRKLLSESHMYKFQTGKEVYKTGNNDPEGLLGDLTAILQAWLGVQTGMILLAFKSDSSRLKRFFIWSVFLGMAGGALCQFKWTGGFIPINKNLWSLSFVLVTSGLATAIFTVMYYLVDVLRLWSGSPFYQPGTNSLFIYFGHYMTFYYFPWSWKVGSMNSHFMRLFECLWGVSVWIMAGLWLKYRKVAWKF